MKEMSKRTTRPSSSPVYTLCGMGKMHVIGAALLMLAGSPWLRTLTRVMDHDEVGLGAVVEDVGGYTGVFGTAGLGVR
jgi:hypothetical protein